MGLEANKEIVRRQLEVVFNEHKGSAAVEEFWAEEAAVHVPRGLVHAFRNVSAVSARVVVIHTPASAINMIEELAGLPADSDPEASAKILARHASEPVRLGAARR